MTNAYALSNFIISATDNYSLGDGDSLFVGADATVINTGSFNAVKASGTVSLQILGDVVATANNAIDASGTMRLTVGRDGSILSPNVAVSSSGANSVINNNGLIASQQFGGIELQGNDSLLTNSGTIEGGNVPVYLSGSNIRFVNTGAVTQVGQQSGFGNGVYIAGNGIVIENLGTISSIQSAGIDFSLGTDMTATFINRGTLDSAASFGISGSSGNEIVVNSGTINGRITLEGGDDQIDLRGGIVRGTIELNDGNDRATIDTSNASGIEVIDGGAGKDMLAIGGVNAVWIDLNWNGVQVWTTDGGIATGANANTMLARITNFEDITDSRGSDVIYGNDLANTFVWTGNAATTADIYAGRGGSDTADFSAAASVWVDLTLLGNEVYTSGKIVAFGAESNTLVANLDSIENIRGTAGSDEVYGDAGDNIFISGGIARINGVVQGVERFDGRGGSDTYDLSGVNIPSAWVDLTLANEVWSSLTGVSTGANANTPIANLTAVENFVGTAGSDQFFGDATNNTYFFTGFTTGSIETFDGRGGVNTFDGSRSNISLWIGLDQPALEVWSVNSTGQSTGASATTQVANLVGVQNIVGSAFADTLIGDAGANRIGGFQGSDILVGNAGSDTFVFSKGDGIDQINDFAIGAAGVGDVIELSGFGPAFDSFAEVFAASSQAGADTLINLGGSDFLRLINYTRTNLVADDFLFT